MPSAWQSLDKNSFRAIAGGIPGRDFGLAAPLPPIQCVRPYPSVVETWVVHTAAYAALDRWVTSNVRPRATARIQTSAAPGSQVQTIERDNHGIALGGIRLPRIALPTALDTGENQAANTMPQNGLCNLVGTHIPFEAAALKALYPTRAAYMRGVRRVIDELVEQSVVLKEDAATLIRSAETGILQ